MMRRIVQRSLIALAVTLLPIGSALASNCSSNPFTLANGQVADATQVMANFNNLLNCANNNLAHNGANSDITSLSALTTPLTVAQGGTGSATLTAHDILVGNGVSPILSTLAPSTSGNLPVSNGTDWIASQTLGGAYLITLTAGSINLSSSPINEAEVNSIAAAATTNIGAAAGNFVVISGNTGITAFDSIQGGARRTLVFTGTPTITASGNIIMPASYTVVAGDVLTFRSEGGGIWTLESYALQTGGVLGPASAAQTLAGTDNRHALTALGFAGNNSIAANGFYKLPAGLIIQWGSVAVAGSSTSTVTFPTAFPSSALSITTTYNTASPPANSATATAISASQMTVANGSGSPQTIFWMAIGN